MEEHCIAEECGCKWKAGTGQTEVKQDRWSEGGLGQQMDDCGGSSTMCKRQEGVESPGAYVDD